MLQNKPNLWSCSVTAFAMALGIPVQQLVEEIGHDGSEKIFTHLPDPMCRRGFHSQELVQAAWNHGSACTPIELYPMLRCEPFPRTFPLRDGLPIEHHVLFGTGLPCNDTRFLDAINSTHGVLEGHGSRCDHAVYYHFGEIEDPDGDQYLYSREACEDRNFHGKRLWIFTQR